MLAVDFLQGAELMPGYVAFSPAAPANFKAVFHSLDEHAQSLLARYLQY